MDKNTVLTKVLDYIWLPIALLPFFNGIGFIYAGWRADETRWMDEGIFYMIPFILLSFTIFNMPLVYFAVLLWFVGIVHAFILLKKYHEKLEFKKASLLHEYYDDVSESNDELASFYKKNNPRSNVVESKNFSKLKEKEEENVENTRRLDL